MKFKEMIQEIKDGLNQLKYMHVTKRGIATVTVQLDGIYGVGKECLYKFNGKYSEQDLKDALIQISRWRSWTTQSGKTVRVTAHKKIKLS